MVGWRTGASYVTCAINELYKRNVPKSKELPP